jgi:Ni,Fe-hydrogenase I small subunit
MHPNFPDPPTSPFFSQVELTPSFLGLNVDTVGEAVGVGAAVVLGAHAVHHVMTSKKKTDQTETPKAKGESQ